MGKSGKTLTFILIIFVVLLVSVTGISLFFFSKEIDLRRAAELNVEQLKQTQTRLQTDLRSAQDQITLLDEKKKEAEGKIESLMQEVDLQKTTKEQVQKENETLQVTLQKESQAKEELRARLSQDLQAAQDKYNAVKVDLDKALAHNKELEDAKAQVESKIQTMRRGGAVVEAPVTETEQTVEGTPAATTTGSGVELGKIVVSPATAKGKVISVDADTDFVIVSLGEKDGITKGAILSVYHDDNYLGDIKVSRVLAAMSAADFVPPLKSQTVKKDDRVIVKK